MKTKETETEPAGRRVFVMLSKGQALLKSISPSALARLGEVNSRNLLSRTRKYTEKGAPSKF